MENHKIRNIGSENGHAQSRVAGFFLTEFLLDGKLVLSLLVSGYSCQKTRLDIAIRMSGQISKSQFGEKRHVWSG